MTPERGRSRSPSVDTLYADYLPYVQHKVRGAGGGLLRRWYDTMDLTNSVFVEVVRDMPRFEYRGEPALLSWLRLKAVSKVRAKFRRVLSPQGGLREEHLDAAKAKTLPSETAGGGSPDRSAATLSDACLERLDEADRALVTYRIRHGYSFKELAATFGLPSEDAARMRVRRALTRLRDGVSN